MPSPEPPRDDGLLPLTRYTALAIVPIVTDVSGRSDPGRTRNSA